MKRSEQAYEACALCGEPVEPAQSDRFGRVRGNIQGYLDTRFTLWKCPKCGTLHSLDPVDYAEIYAHYPLNERRLDVFARGTLGNLLKRLQRHGLQKHHRLLDYGCGNGLFVEFLKKRGYTKVEGWDPYVPGWQKMPSGRFDWIVANDVIEHVDQPRELIRDCLDRLQPEGRLYVGTADAEGVTDMANLDPHIMRLHQPYHRVILTQEGLLRLGREAGLEPLASWRRSYMDRWVPFSNYRFLDEFNRAHGHDMNRAMAPDAGRIMAKRPQLWFWAFFGYLYPSAMEPAVIWRFK
jgi:2-polyprenyl-3-methyl-5-hydroxy-6-metoxy-1,4-benzoquinol methylase